MFVPRFIRGHVCWGVGIETAVFEFWYHQAYDNLSPVASKALFCPNAQLRLNNKSKNVIFKLSTIFYRSQCVYTTMSYDYGFYNDPLLVCKYFCLQFWECCAWVWNVRSHVHLTLRDFLCILMTNWLQSKCLTWSREITRYLQIYLISPSGLTQWFR